MANTVIKVGTTHRLKGAQLISYGIGHHMNDLCAACWFTYLLVFLQSPGICLDQMTAGLIMLSGQLAAAAALVLALNLNPNPVGQENTVRLAGTTPSSVVSEPAEDPRANVGSERITRYLFAHADYANPASRQFVDSHLVMPAFHQAGWQTSSFAQ